MEQDIKSLLAAVMAARAALSAICNIQDERRERYVSQADELAIDALIALDFALEDMGLAPITICWPRFYA